ncbi:MAG: hypothetical protein ABH843_01865 [Candidatus Omnitrophota bacterium]
MITLLTHILTIVLLTQSTGAVCLKPHTLSENSSLRPPAFAITDKKGKASSAGIYWHKNPGGRQAKNPYGDEYAVSKSFMSIDIDYRNDISAEIEKRIKELRGKRVKILFIGAGRGFEAFGLIQKYGDKIDITAANKEDLLYSDPEILKKRFAGLIDDELIETRNITEVKVEEAQEYIKTLRSQYIRCDLNKGIPIDDKYDIVIFGQAVVVYLRKKLLALQEGLRVCKDYGIVYFDFSRFFILRHGRESLLAYYIDSPYIRRMEKACVKLINAPELKLPNLIEHKVVKEHGTDEMSAYFYKSVYKIAGSKDLNSLPANPKSSSSGLQEHDEVADMFTRIAEESKAFIESHKKAFQDANFTTHSLTHCVEFKRRLDRYELDFRCDIYSNMISDGVYHVTALVTIDEYMYVVDVYLENASDPKINRYNRKGFNIETLGILNDLIPWHHGQMRMWNTLAQRLEEEDETGTNGRNKSSSSGQQTLGTVLKGTPNHLAETLDIASGMGQAPSSIKILHNHKILTTLDSAA